MQKIISLVCAFALAVSAVTAMAQNTTTQTTQIDEEVVAQNLTDAPPSESALGVLLGLTAIVLIGAIAGGSDNGPRAVLGYSVNLVD